MRLRSIHPKYLDTKWLLAVWREWLLAKHVLEWKTKWYKNHPQLIRFKIYENSIGWINNYLSHILLESKNRWYKFDWSKVKFNKDQRIINVTKWQIAFEFKHLLKKLKSRTPIKYKEIKDIKEIETHPTFKIIEWNIEKREII